MSEKCSQAGHQIGEGFIGEETLVNVLKSWSPSW